MDIKNLPPIDSFREFVAEHKKPITGWLQVILVLAGLYNIAFGLWATLYPRHYFQLNSLAMENTSLWQCLGVLVGLYGLLYLFTATDITRYWPIVLIGLIGKTLGPIVFLTILYTGEAQIAGLVIILFSDLIWLIPFAFILLKVLNQHWRDKNGIKINCENEIAAYQSLLDDSENSPLLLIFLRQFGCVFCQEALRTFTAEYSSIRAKGIKPIIVHLGTKEYFTDYFKHNGLSDVVQILDSNQLLYSFFRLKRGSLFDIFSPAIFLEARKVMANLKIKVRAPLGDGFQLAGCFLIDKGQVIRSHKNHDATNKISYLDFINSEKNDELADLIPSLTLYFDGDCPLCRREIDFLKSITIPGSVLYEDISNNNFTALLGKDCSSLMKEIHARDSNGSWLIGMDAFRAVYAFTPYKSVLQATNLPVIRTFFDFAYYIFARNRLRLTGKRNLTCSI